MSRVPVLRGVAFYLGALLLGAGCSKPPVARPAPAVPQEDVAAALKAATDAAARGAAQGKSVSVVTVGGRQVKTVADGSISSSAQDERAVVNVGGRKLAFDFAKGHVVLDDKEQAKLPATVKNVDIEHAGGKLSVKADGVELFPAAKPE